MAAGSIVMPRVVTVPIKRVKQSPLAFAPIAKHRITWQNRGNLPCWATRIYLKCQKAVKLIVQEKL